jgi:hypothetical protein
MSVDLRSAFTNVTIANDVLTFSNPANSSLQVVSIKPAAAATPVQTLISNGTVVNPLASWNLSSAEHKIGSVFVGGKAGIVTAKFKVTLPGGSGDDYGQCYLKVGEYAGSQFYFDRANVTGKFVSCMSMAGPGSSDVFVAYHWTSIDDLLAISDITIKCIDIA